MGLEWPEISPVEDPVSTMKACPNLLYGQMVQLDGFWSNSLLASATNSNDPFAFSIPVKVIATESLLSNKHSGLIRTYILPPSTR
jgi:hypothetical protein